MWHDSQYASVTQSFEYAGICLGRVLKIPGVLDMPQYGTICHDMKMRVVHRVLNMPQYG